MSLAALLQPQRWHNADLDHLPLPRVTHVRSRGHWRGITHSSVTTVQNPYRLQVFHQTHQGSSELSPGGWRR